MKADPNCLIAITIFLAMKGDESLLLKLEQELVEIWNGDGI